MKTTRVKMIDADGNIFWWTFQAQPNVVIVGEGLRKPRHSRGWSFTDHEGYERFSEGNWLALAGMFRAVAANYGFTTTLS